MFESCRSLVGHRVGMATCCAVLSACYKIPEQSNVDSEFRGDVVLSRSMIVNGENRSIWNHWNACWEHNPTICSSLLGDIGLEPPPPLGWLEASLRPRASQFSSGLDNVSAEYFPRSVGPWEFRLWYRAKWSEDIVVLRLWGQPLPSSALDARSWKSSALRGQVIFGLARGECPVGRWDSEVCDGVLETIDYDLCFVNIDPEELGDVAAIVPTCGLSRRTHHATPRIHATTAVVQQATFDEMRIFYYNDPTVLLGGDTCADAIQDAVSEIRDIYVPAEWGHRFGRQWYNWWDAERGCLLRTGPYPVVAPMCCQVDADAGAYDE